tara:strand:- start:1265 stop:1984 length:720 start_codon:yes stop_codon:yes gene_type:complete
MSSTLSLNLLTNYLPAIQESNLELYQYYIALIQTLLNHIYTNITIKNEEYLKYIINYGIDTITHIYKLLLLYTKNVSLTVHHCEKSILFYVEFITQIGDDNHSFLQLTSKDAVMFLYKKTLFELEENYVKTCVHTPEHISKIEEFHQISKIISNMIHQNVYYYTNMDTLMKDVVDITSLVKNNKDMLLKYNNEFLDLIELLTPYIKSSITTVNKILVEIHPTQDINILSIFHKLSDQDV